MSKVQFQVRIEEETQKQIDVYTGYLNVLTGMFINLGDLNRAIVEEGIRSLIKKRGGIELMNKVIDQEAEDLYQEVKNENEKNK